MKHSAQKYFSIVLIPSSGKRSHSFRLSKLACMFILTSLSLFIIGIVYASYYVTQTNFNLTEYRLLKAKTSEQTLQLKNVELNIENLQDSLRALNDKEIEIQELLGEKPKKKRRRYSKKKKKDKSITLNLSTIDIAQALLTDLEDAIHKKKLKIIELLKKTQQFRSRFASTPSIWPVDGRILSDFGWRRHPIKRRRSYHKGIDIPSAIGAPVKASADGRISYSGYAGSFGNTIVINHGFGYKTLYAHCLQRLVEKNETVKKGQIIAQVGSTGLSTGAHLHYEVHKWRKRIDPKTFLRLDMFTASARIW